jgi:hypothetical protein
MDPNKRFPFANISNAQLANTFGSNSSTNTQLGNVNEQIVDNTSVFSTGPGSSYTTSYVYQIPPNVDHVTALRMVHAAMVNRVQENDQARIRIWYRDRETSVRIQSTSQSYTNATHTRIFNGRFQLLMGFDALETSVNFLLTSNELLELEDLFFVLDIRDQSYLGGGEGVKRGRKALEKCEDTDTYTPDSYKHFEGVMTLPRQTDQLCGWICLALHILYWFTPEDSEQYNLPKSIFTLVDRVAIPNKSRTLALKHSYAKIIYKVPKLMCEAGLIMKNHLQSNCQAFSPADEQSRLNSTFPWLKLVVFSYNSKVLFSTTGSQWSLSEKSDQQQSAVTAYFSFETFVQHYHYVSDTRKFFLNIDCSKTASYKKWWCHGCLTLVNIHKRNEHKCQELKCDCCSMYFKTQAEYNRHKNNELPVSNVILEVIDNDQIDYKNTTCENCLLKCKSFECLLNHKKICKTEAARIQCQRCLLYYYARSNHNCNPDREMTCSNCKSKVPACQFANHRCFMKTEQAPKDYDIVEQGKHFYAFDFESQFLPAPSRLVKNLDNTIEEVEVHRHEVNYVCVQQCFTENKWSFQTLKEFVNWLDSEFQYKPGNVVFIAHNLKGYDGRLLYDHYVVNEKTIPDNCMWNGTKIMSMTVGKIIFRDSLLHIATSLDKFPKIFGLDETKIAKGFFPYKFNVPANQSYVGKIPEIKYFEPDMMNSDKRHAFLNWYESQKHLQYNFRIELERYCQSDVNVLAKSLEVYITEGMTMNSGLNPLDCATIASYAFKVYKTLHLPENTLAVLNEEELEFAKRSMHGGRTDVRKMIQFYSKDQVEKGIYAKYQDVQSLYPTVQFYDKLPCGIPKIHRFFDPINKTFKVDNQPSIDDVINNWFGIVECDLQVVKYLHHPVIVEKIDGKLMATLHDKKNVVLTTPELQAALKTGCYKLLRVIQYHEYKPSTTLFKSYLRQYLKIKIENSGMPSHIKNDQQWSEFQEYHRNELGIELVRENMVKNPGKKQLAKMMLNSLWGKFAESQNYCTHAKVNLKNEFQIYENLWDCCLIDIVLNININTETSLLIYKDADNSRYRKSRASRNNMALASFVTAYGALRLWDEMNKLGSRVLYHDTDSVIYEHNPNLYNIPEGKYLGEWEDETGGKPIIAFTSTGPKTYSYATLQNPVPYNEHDLRKRGAEYWLSDDEQTVREIVYASKCKGFSLNSYNSQQVNFKSMHQLILGKVPWLKTKALKFYWSRLKNAMTSNYESKYLTFKYDKGHIDKLDYTVYPFGYKSFIEDAPEK